MPDLMGDAHACGEEDAGAVAGEPVVPAVRAFDEAGQADDSRGGGPGAVVQRARHACAFGDDHVERCGGAVGGGQVELGFGGGELVAFEGEVRGWTAVGPGDGERMVHPEGEAREVDVSVCSWGVCPGPGELEGNATGLGAGFAGEGFDRHSGEAFAGDIAIHESE